MVRLSEQREHHHHVQECCSCQEATGQEGRKGRDVDCRVRDKEDRRRNGHRVTDRQSCGYQGKHTLVVVC